MKFYKVNVLIKTRCGFEGHVLQGVLDLHENDGIYARTYHETSIFFFNLINNFYCTTESLEITKIKCNIMIEVMFDTYITNISTVAIWTNISSTIILFWQTIFQFLMHNEPPGKGHTGAEHYFDKESKSQSLSSLVSRQTTTTTKKTFVLHSLL